MDLLGALGVLVRVVETGSFSPSPVSATSVRLRSPRQVSQRVYWEEHFGVRLFSPHDPKA